MVFDASLRASNFLRNSEKVVTIELDLDIEHTSKKVIRFFPSLIKDTKLQFMLKNLRPREEAKVT